MTKECAYNMRNGRGGAGCLFAGRRETVESVKIEVIAFKLVAITVATNQEHYCSTLQTSVPYAKLPMTFVGGVSNGKFR